LLCRSQIITDPIIIPRDHHRVSRADISGNALRVLNRLHSCGHQAYLVGGGVRDLLLGHRPKDFDVATDATPEQVRAIFRNCRLIGRRFRLAHVIYGRDVIEVATFRGSHKPDQAEQHQTDNGMLMRDNVWGTLEEDAERRDFSVNALYYNIADFSIVDYAGGMRDLERGILRMLGDAETRYREDPVRMLRALRFAAKLDFDIDPEADEPIPELACLLDDVPAARLFEEVLKLFMGGYAEVVYDLLQDYALFERLFPPTARALADAPESAEDLLVRGLVNTDKRVLYGKPVTPGFLFAVLLWEPVRQLAERNLAGGDDQAVAVQRASSAVLVEQVKRVSIPRRFSTMSREIWHLQHRFHTTKGKRPQRLASHPRFRAAYDFLQLRGAAGEVDPALVEWWRAYYEASETVHADAPKKKRRPRRRGRKPAATGDNAP